MYITPEIMESLAFTPGDVNNYPTEPCYCISKVVSLEVVTARFGDNTQGYEKIQVRLELDGGGQVDGPVLNSPFKMTVGDDGKVQAVWNQQLGQYDLTNELAALPDADRKKKVNGALGGMTGVLLRCATSPTAEEPSFTSEGLAKGWDINALVGQYVGHAYLPGLKAEDIPAQYRETKKGKQARYGTVPNYGELMSVRKARNLIDANEAPADNRKWPWDAATAPGGRQAGPPTQAGSPTQAGPPKPAGGPPRPPTGAGGPPRPPTSAGGDIPF